MTDQPNELWSCLRIVSIVIVIIAARNKTSLTIRADGHPIDSGAIATRIMRPTNNPLVQQQLPQANAHEKQNEIDHQNDSVIGVTRLKEFGEENVTNQHGYERENRWQFGGELGGREAIGGEKRERTRRQLVGDLSVGTSKQFELVMNSPDGPSDEESEQGAWSSSHESGDGAAHSVQDKFIRVAPNVQTSVNINNGLWKQPQQQQQQTFLIGQSQQARRKQQLVAQSASPASSSAPAPTIGARLMATEARHEGASGTREKASLQLDGNIATQLQSQHHRWRQTFGAETAGSGGELDGATASLETTRAKRPPNAYAAPVSTSERAPKAMKVMFAAKTTTTTTTTTTTAEPNGFVSPNKDQEDYLNRLYLDTSLEPQLKHVRAHLGETARLLCRLRANMQLQGQLQISWVRNMQILTIGESPYTSDERFKPIHPQHSNDWILEIHNVQASDEADYECQVNSEPKAASLRVHLHVLTAQVDILEAPEVELDEGEQIQLTCQVEFYSAALRGVGVGPEPEPEHLSKFVDSQATGQLGQSKRQAGSRKNSMNGRTDWKALNRLHQQQQQHYIYWYKDNISLEYNNPRGDIQVQRHNDESNGYLESILQLSETSLSDNGTYECKLVPELNGVRSAQVNVFVGNKQRNCSNVAQTLNIFLFANFLLVSIQLMIDRAHNN